MRMLTKIMHKEELEEREVLSPHGLTERKSTRKSNRKIPRESELISWFFILPYMLRSLSPFSPALRAMRTFSRAF